jgi:hypothetical protein
MGTRSLTFFYEDGKPFCAFYRQMDGYPSGHGVNLGKILAGITIVNGYGLDMKAGTHANGPGCLAAQVIAALKNEHGLGGIYMVNPDPANHKEGWQEYEYHVHVNVNEANDRNWRATFDTHIVVNDTQRDIFTGSFEEFYVWAQDPPTSPEGDYLVTKGLVAKVGKLRVYKELRDALQHEEVHVQFRKADDSIRTMRCTTDMVRIDENDHPSLNTIENKNLYKVYDLDIGEWRSFRNERVIDWRVV